jgi:hypothetical protein
MQPAGASSHNGRYPSSAWWGTCCNGACRQLLVHSRPSF